MKHRWRFWASAAFILGLAFAIAGGGIVVASAQGSKPITSSGTHFKVTICHRTDSNTNPYVQITVDSSAVDGDTTNDYGQGDHFAEHKGPIWNPTLKAQGIKWGDIIPPPPMGVVPGGLNWTAEGIAIFNNGCKIPATTTTTMTTVINVATGLPVSGAVPADSKVFDVAQVSPSGATGTVSFTFFANVGCSGGGTPAGSGPVGTNSMIEGPLAPGDFSFKATFVSDSAQFTDSSSSCEPFTVAAPPLIPTTTSTTVFNAANNAAVTAPLPAPASVFDKATVTPSSAPILEVSYTFFSNGGCSGTGAPAGTGAKSMTESGLAPGNYSFQATFAGDDIFNKSTSACEPFVVIATEGVPTTLTTTVFDAATSAPLNNATLTAGGSVFDGATVHTSGGGTPTGDVSFMFFHNGNCSGTAIDAGSGPLGTNSSTEGPLAAGSFSFKAVFTGDEEFKGSTSACEPFTVTAPVTTTTPTPTAVGGAPTVASPTPTPTGEILAETGANPPGLGFGVALILLGFAAMFAGALFWRRQRA